MNAYVKGLITEAEAEQQLPKLRRERDQIAAELASTEQAPNVLTLHPSAVSEYLRQVEELAETLSSHAHNGMDKASEVLRSLVHSVTVYPNVPREGFEVEVRGRLAELVGGKAFSTGQFSGVNVVAEEGFEPRHKDYDSSALSLVPIHRCARRAHGRKRRKGQMPVIL
jgi:hypothetical protein